MIKSMTAYSRSSARTPFGSFVVEIHSVNRKLLDLSVYLPKDLIRFDIDIRKWLKKALERGQVTLRLSIQSEGSATRSAATLNQLKNLKESWEYLCKELGYNPKQAIDFPFLVGQLQTASSAEWKEEEEEALQATLQTLVENALKDLLQMKKTEGKALATDIEKRLKIIEGHLASIELKKEQPLVFYRKKLTERLKDVGGQSPDTEERIAREIALLAEKMDVTEELVRFRSHIDQFRKHLLTHDVSIGRTLDFLAQEMHREINTLGSKSSDSEISLYVVEVKSELDKIKEQVQNIE